MKIRFIIFIVATLALVWYVLLHSTVVTGDDILVLLLLALPWAWRWVESRYEAGYRIGHAWGVFETRTEKRENRDVI